ncbi:hypothetical protein HDV02_002208 [Globomyces sp. JEL0801]|nr:hypothetical protein HDV02_002208 [Globomyces sp. JEL0801]
MKSIRGYEQSTSEYIWILDSNIRMEPDSLNRSMNIFLNDSKIGLVHHLPCGINPLSFGAYLDAVYLSCTHARMYTAANTLATTSCVIGKSNLFRKCDLDQCGGLRYFGKYLAEDNIIGSHILDLGFKHQIAPDLAFQSLGNVSFYTFMERRIRWIRVRKYTVFFVTLIESLAECLINSILMAAICFQLFSIPFIHYIIAQWIIWFLLDMNIALQTFFPYRQKNLDIFKFICAWMIRELLAFPIWLIAMIGTEVIWRGQPYQLFTDGTVEPILKSDKDINELLIVVESDQKEFLNS